MIKEKVQKVSQWMENSKKDLQQGGGQSIELFVQRNIFLKEIQKNISGQKEKYDILKDIQEVLKD